MGNYEVTIEREVSPELREFAKKIGDRDLGNLCLELDIKLSLSGNGPKHREVPNFIMNLRYGTYLVERGKKGKIPYLKTLGDLEGYDEDKYWMLVQTLYDITNKFDIQI